LAKWNKERINTIAVFPFYTKPVTFYIKSFRAGIWYKNKGGLYNIR